MIKCHTKRWGNSIGIILPKRIVAEKSIKPHEEILIEIKGKSGNVLKELFGAFKSQKSTKQMIAEVRKDFESRYA